MANSKKGGGQPKEVALKIYGGRCPIGCHFCQSGVCLDEPTAVAEADLVKQIKALAKSSIAIIGLDYEPLSSQESIHGLTKLAIRMLGERGIQYRIITRTSGVTEYKDLMDRELAHIEISLNLFNDGAYIIRNEEWGAYPTMRELAAEIFARDHYDVALRISPFCLKDVDYHELSNLYVKNLIIEFPRSLDGIELVSIEEKKLEVREFVSKLPAKRIYVSDGSKTIDAAAFLGQDVEEQPKVESLSVIRRKRRTAPRKETADE